ncbi:MAG: hypothetical protein JWP44_1831 [Mucilaginibacter sp.]|nr:hypothetical protein [Mucilaginibacter sp.]
MNNNQLIQLLEALKTDVINSLQANGANATGQTAKQLTITTGGNAIQLELPGYMQLLETGRGPTSKDAVAGNPPMIQRIKQWGRAKGIPDKAAWAIKKSIDKNGYKGKPGILTEPLGDDNINRRLNPVMESVAAALIKDLIGK